MEGEPARVHASSKRVLVNLVLKEYQLLEPAAPIITDKDRLGANYLGHRLSSRQQRNNRRGRNAHTQEFLRKLRRFITQNSSAMIVFAIRV
jgi:hypothetical protein